MQTSQLSFGMCRTLGMAVVIGLCAGCATTTYRQGNVAGDATRVAGAEVESQSRTLSATVDVLDHLVNEPQPDLRVQFERYEDALEHLYDSIERTEHAMQRMQERTDAYFERWDEQIAALNYEVTRNASNARRVTVSNDFDQVTRRYRETREVVLPLLAYLEDIRKVLGADLTAAGLESVKGIVKNARENADKVQNALAQLSSELAESGGKLSSSMIAQAPADGAGSDAGQGAALEVEERTELKQ